MEPTQAPVDSLIEQLGEADRPAWARWALDRLRNGWTLRHVEITIGGRPPGYSNRKWVYPDYAFVEQRPTHRQLAAALRGRSVRLRRLTVRGRSTHVTADRRRLQSFADFGGQRLPWPVVRYEVSSQEQYSASGGGDPLISTEVPSFPYYDAAFSAFFRPEGSARWQQNPTVVVNIADTDARIAGLAIRPGEVLVDVDGENLRGCSIQVTSDGTSKKKAIGGPCRVAFRLPDPFVRELFVVLVDDHWRDLRLLNPPGMPTVADPSIVWEDPRLQLEALLAGGEGSRVEFKSKLPTKSIDSIRTALKAVPAFANGGGGVLMFGVDDDGVVVGLTENATEATSRLNDLVHDNVHPVPVFRIACHEVSGKLVAVVEVESGAGKPFALFRKPPLFFARHGATTFHATRDEIIMFANH